MASTQDYRPRVADAELEERLAAAGTVLIEGPRASGKTWAAQRLARSQVLLDVDETARRLARLDPAELLAGPTPRLLDEWQLEPGLWNHMRRAVDDRQAAGQFILTGSAVPSDDITRHSGAGRVSRLRLRPMSLFELGRSTGSVSLRAVLGGERVPSSEARLGARALADLVCFGGWPANLGKSPRAALRANRDYIEEVCRTDVPNLDGTRHNPERVSRLLQSYARNVSTTASISTLAADVGGPGPPLSEGTAHTYLATLQRLMLIEPQPPWGPHLRSRSRLRSTPKRHFADPSLATAALRADARHLMGDIAWFGLLFESLVVRDLRVYAQAMDAHVYHYRDNTGLEVDVIVDGGPGRWAAFEVKLGTHRIDDAAKILLKFAKRVDTDRCGEPAALCVIVHDGYAYERADGVAVIPVAALGP
ncbi:ATP-binding protein [Candidatus Palauibacter sp.]|uniref:ATP-binding protein n=1 Tax=Candidatus Palauibacter sp. TaxID=3101350 RepID=UPI003B01C8C9